MQTFLPYPSFLDSAVCLDYRRLGKQRVEAKQILKAIILTELQKRGVINPDAKIGWSNHPAVDMWRDHIPALLEYYNTMIYEWIRRGYINNMPTICITDDIIYPEWLGRRDFHAAHRSNLMAKDTEFYSQYRWCETDNLEYIWG